MRHTIKWLMLQLGPVLADVLALLGTSAGINLLTSDPPKGIAGALLLLGGVLTFIASKDLAQLYADARSHHDRNPDQKLRNILSEFFEAQFTSNTKLWLFGFGLALSIAGLTWHLRAPLHNFLATNPSGANISKTPEKTVPARPVIRLATSKNLWCTLTLIALDQGMFAQEGLDVQATYQLAGRQNMDALVSKSVEIANIVEVNHAYQALNGNQDLSIIGSIVAARDFAVIAKKKTGILRPKDLVHRTLAFAPGTGAEMFVYALLKKNGIDPATVKLKRVQPAALVDAIAAPEVDAAASWEPFVSSMKARLGAEAVEVETGNPYVGVMNVAVRREWLSQNRETSVRFLRALERAAELVRQRPNDAQSIVARVAGLDPRLVASIWGRFDLALSLDKPRQVELLRFVMDSIISNEPEYSGKRRPEVEGYFEIDELKEAVGK